MNNTTSRFNRQQRPFRHPRFDAILRQYRRCRYRQNAGLQSLRTTVYFLLRSRRVRPGNPQPAHLGCGVRRLNKRGFSDVSARQARPGTMFKASLKIIRQRAICATVVKQENGPYTVSRF